MRDLWNVEWPNINAQRKYPFAQSASLAASESFQLPNDVIVDFVLAVNTTVAPDPTLFHVQQIGVFSAGLVLSFAYDGTPFSTVSIPRTGFVPYTPYTLTGTGDFYDCSGWVTIGNLENVFTLPGAHELDVDTGRLLPAAIRPRPQGVSSIAVANGQDVSARLSGALKLMAGTNVRFRVDASGTDPIIYVDAVDGSGMAEDCDCLDEDVEAPPIRTINGIAPDDAGNFTLEESSCVSITSKTNGLLFGDNCSDPCCGCDELEVITDDLILMKQQVQSMEMTASKLDLAQSNLTNNIIVSKTTGVPKI